MRHSDRSQSQHYRDWRSGGTPAFRSKRNAYLTKPETAKNHKHQPKERMRLHRTIGLLLFYAAAIPTAHGEDGSQAWLRYAPITNTTTYANLPSTIIALGNTPTDQA